MACPSTNSEEQDLFAKLLKKRFDRQPCCAGILYECMRFLIGHYKVNAAEEFLFFGCVRTEHRLVSAYINRIINVAWCFGHGILLDPEASILCPFQPVLQGGQLGDNAAARSIVIGGEEASAASVALILPAARSCNTLIRSISVRLIAITIIGPTLPIQNRGE
jgi:hypothetical protein